MRKLIRHLIHLYYKLRHYFKKPERVEPLKPIRKRTPRVIMQEQVDLDTSLELARQWDSEDVSDPKPK
tara:strand:+ start:667 stop:870 length:204 start_codon:yes stop_codon:yes gene_type:complete